MMDDGYLKLARNWPKNSNSQKTKSNKFQKNVVCSFTPDVASIQAAMQHPVIARAAFLSATDSQQQ